MRAVRSYRTRLVYVDGAPTEVVDGPAAGPLAGGPGDFPVHALVPIPPTPARPVWESQFFVVAANLRPGEKSVRLRTAPYFKSDMSVKLKVGVLVTVRRSRCEGFLAEHRGNPFRVWTN